MDLPLNLDRPCHPLYDSVARHPAKLPSVSRTTVVLWISSVSAETTGGPSPGLIRADELLSQALPEFRAHRIVR